MPTPTNNRHQKAEQEEAEMLRSVSPNRIIIPILIGLAFVTYMLWSNWDPEAFAKIDWTGKTVFFLCLATIGIVGRHFFYMCRIRLLTDNFFSWRKAFEMILIWEFSSAVTPTSAGGSAVVLFTIPQEKLSTGKTAALVVYTIIIDTVFFGSQILLWYLIFGSSVYAPAGDTLWTGIFKAALPIVMLWGAFLAVGVFILPTMIRRILFIIFSLPLIKRFRRFAVNLGNDIVEASAELRQRPPSFFLKSYLFTALAWFSRFSVLVCIIFAFVDFQDIINNPNNPIQGMAQWVQALFFYIRQITLYVIMEIFPSPGGAGGADDAFRAFTSDLLPEKIAGFAVVIGLLWRLLTYYIYLFVGSIVVPNWFRSVVNRRRAERAAKALQG